MKKIQRTNCIFNNTSDLSEVVNFKNFPIKMTCEIDHDSSKDIFSDMRWGISASSGIIQLMDLIPPNYLYDNYHNPGSVGSTWKTHHEKFANFIAEDSPKTILEIGGSDGNLVKIYCENNDDFRWNIIEPSEKLLNNDKINFINSYFEDYTFNETFDAVVYSHVFEHIYEFSTFFNKIDSVLHENSYQYISIPNMRYWVNNGYTNALNFEHTFYVDELVIENILTKYQYEIISKNVSTHSIFIKAKKNKNIIQQYYNLNYIKPMFLNYVNKLLEDINYIKTIIKNNKVYIFGAHVFSQYLLFLGISEKNVISILDNNPFYFGKRLYGTNLLVDNPEILCNEISPIVVVRAGVYSEEIKVKLKMINDGIIFL